MPLSNLSLWSHRGFVRVLLLVGVALVLRGSASAGVNHWTSNGPYGGSIEALVADPSHPGIAYAGILGYGVFKTVDGGANWATVNDGLDVPVPLPLYVRALAIDPQTPSTLYAGLQQGGVFKTTDGGATWRSLGLDDVTSLCVDPQRPTTLYVGSGSGLSKSVDGGASWSSMNQGLSFPPVVLSVAVDPAHPDVLYVATNTSSAIFRSQDGGNSWAPSGASPADDPSRGVSVDSASRVFAVSDHGLFRSADGGMTWTMVLPGLYLSVVVPVGASDLFVAGGPSSDQPYPSQAFRSTDGGEQWTVLAGLPAPAPKVFASSAGSPETVYAGAPYGVVTSTDGGQTWSPANGGMRGVGAVPVMDPQNPDLVYAASTAGLFRSGDGARSWSLTSPDPQFSSVDIQPGSLDLYSALGRSTDGGETWQPVAYPLDGVGHLVIAAGQPSTLLVASYFDPVHPARVFKSTDSGASWTASLDPGLSGAVTSLAVSSSGEEVYATISGLPIHSFEQSTDGGATWVGVDTSGWPSDWQLSDFGVVAIDPTDAHFVYASVEGRLYRSSIGGGQWVDISAGLPAPQYDGGLVASGLAIDPSSPTRIYAATPHGVFRSPDRGATWTSLSDGLPDGPAAGLVIDSSGRFLHVGAGGSIYDFEIAAPCVATASSLCLLGGRFIATVEAADPRTGRIEVGTAVPQNDRYGYFSLPGFTGDPSFPEILVKMADATSMGEGFWVFHSGLTDLQYTLSIVDTVTGRQKSYRNDRSNPQSLCGGADTATFTTEPVGNALSPSPRSTKVLPGEGSPALTLLGRFQATLSAVDPRTGSTATGIAVPQGTKWGYFSLPTFTGDATFPEVFVKMLDGTSLGGYFWVFHTGLTDLEYTLTVTDSKTGEAKSYRNDRSDPTRLCGGADTHAFAD